MSDEEHRLFGGLTRELATANTPFLNLELDADQAFTLLGMLQLALRHPLVRQTMRDQAQQMAQSLQNQLAALGPNTKAICRMGWQTASDDNAA